MEFLQQVAARLYEIRKEMRLNQQQMGEIMGVSRASYSLYENGKLPIDILMLNKLHEKTGYSLDYLLGRTNMKANDNSLSVAKENLGLTPKAINKLKSDEILQSVINHILCSGAASVFAQKAAILHDSHFMLSQPETNEDGRSYFERNANEQFGQLTALLSVIFTEPDFLSDNLLGTKELYFPKDKTQELIDKYKSLKTEFTKIINKNTDKDPELVESLKRTISTIEKLIDKLSEE